MKRLTAPAAYTTSKTHSCFFLSDGEAVAPHCSTGRKEQPHKSACLVSGKSAFFLRDELRMSGSLWLWRHLPWVPAPRNLECCKPWSSPWAPKLALSPGQGWPLGMATSFPGGPSLLRCCSPQLSRMIQCLVEGKHRCCQSLSSHLISSLVWWCLKWKVTQGSQPVFSLHPSISHPSVWRFQSGAALRPNSDLGTICFYKGQICREDAGKLQPQ